MSLSDAEWTLVLKAWGPVEADLAGHGQAVLLRAFISVPEQADLPGSADIKAHGSIVITKLGDLLKQKGGHAALLRPLGETHAKKHKSLSKLRYREKKKCKKKGFLTAASLSCQLICDVIVKVLAEKYSSFGADSQAAMTKALDLIFSGMGPLYQEFGFAG
ncbi:myoglobin [Polyodon spathula]|uniref:myoglobin n=1 Tax=Polyodon spathula TaxID=7913 RepID=UPI001B7E5DDC|nr:myoglobin [Polyodon spathula]